MGIKLHQPFLAVVFILGLTGCASLRPFQSAALDFPAIINGQGTMVHVDEYGVASAEPIGFLKDQRISQWDVASVDEIVTTDKVEMLSDDGFELKYYRNKIYAKSFSVHARYIEWMVILPEEDCLILQAYDFSSTRRLVRINLTTGDEKEVKLGVFPGINCKPLWDEAAKKLIALVVDKHPAPNNSWPFYSLASLDPDDLTLRDSVEIHDANIIGLLYADGGGKHVTAYGMFGDAAVFHHGTNGFIEITRDTGQSTLVMKDILSGIFLYEYTGIAAVNSQYVLMTKVGGYSFESPQSYIMDPKNQDWKQLSGIPPFTYPIGHDGLLVK